MDDDGEDLDNLFDEYESNDPQPAENDIKNDDETAEKVPVPKRVVKHPRLKFNPERLCGKRGIPVLVDHFKDVKFKGKGHEKEDLKKVLTTLELWTHRLFPSMKFEDCLRQIEHLGKKRPVKTCLQKIRIDFPILDADFLRNENEEQEQPNETEPEPPVEDAFDRLFNNYQESDQPVHFSTPSSSQIERNVLGTSFGANITDEQKKRMEYNKMLAIERRKNKLSVMQSSNLADSSDAANKESNFNSTSTQSRVENDDPDFLFNYLQEQFSNTQNFNGNEKIEKSSQSTQLKDREEMDDSIEPVDEGNKDENVLHTSVRDDCPRGDDKEQLGLDELMDLVDEGDKDETDHTLHIKDDSLKNNKELGLEELMDLVDDNDDALLSVETASSSTDKNGHLSSIQTDANIIDFVEKTDKSESNEDEHIDRIDDDLRQQSSIT